MHVRYFRTAILLTLAASAGAAGTANDPFSAMRIRRIAPPAPAGNLVLSSTERRQIRLSDFRGKVVLVEFFVAN
jgi:hypothetical protein